jgi:hypothetical protein
MGRPTFYRAHQGFPAYAGKIRKTLLNPFSQMRVLS